MFAASDAKVYLMAVDKNLLVDLSLTTLVGPDGGLACADSPVKKLFASGTNLAEESSLLKMSAKPETSKILKYSGDLIVI